jgi:enoyl-CoA hydratase/carnithine racemase
VLTAQQALGWGMVTEVVEPDALDEHVGALCERLSGYAPLTMWAAKEAMRRLLEPFPTDEDIMRRVLGSEDCREGIVAFLEKRPPIWRNR